MKPKSPPIHKQTHLLYQDLLEQLNPKDPLLLLAGKLSWELFEREFAPLAKGKEHKKYEFGSKAAIAMTKTRCIIVGVKSFSRNEHDGDTLKTILPQVKKIMGKAPRRALCDRGFRGRKRVGDTTIILPESPSPNASEYAKRKARKDFGRRSAIEPVIRHLKGDVRWHALSQRHNWRCDKPAYVRYRLQLRKMDEGCGPKSIFCTRSTMQIHSQG